MAARERGKACGGCRLGCSGYKRGDVILKLVNYGGNAKRVSFILEGLQGAPVRAQKPLFQGSPEAISRLRDQHPGFALDQLI